MSSVSYERTKLVVTTLVIVAGIMWICKRFNVGFTLKLEVKPAVRKTPLGHNRLMQLNTSNQIQLKLPPKLVFVTDLDHTLFGTKQRWTHEQSNTSIKRFNKIWCEQYAPRNCVLVYATGRNFGKYKLAVEQWSVMQPDILVTGDGVTIHWFNKKLAQQVQARSTHNIDMSFDDEQSRFVWRDTSWEAALSKTWDQDFAEKVHDEVYEKFELLGLPPGSVSKEQFRIGVLCEGSKRAKDIEQYYIKRVADFNSEHKEDVDFEPMEIHSFTCVERNMELEGHDDAYWSAFTPERAGKGCAVEFLQKRLHTQADKMICCGDSCNDTSMLSIAGMNSVVVSNASTDLLKFYDEQQKAGASILKTNGMMAEGVIEGLKYFAPQVLTA